MVSGVIKDRDYQQYVCRVHLVLRGNHQGSFVGRICYHWESLTTIRLDTERLPASYGW